MRDVVLFLALAGASGCSGQPAGDPPARAPERSAPMNQTQTTPVRDLPFAGGRTFNTLDEYLAHLRTQSAFDAPAYVEVEPGVYELSGGRRPRGAAAPRFTRAQLLEQYGFTR